MMHACHSKHCTYYGCCTKHHITERKNACLKCGNEVASGGSGSSFMDQPLSSCSVSASNSSRASCMQTGLMCRMISAADLPVTHHIEKLMPCRKKS